MLEPGYCKVKVGIDTVHLAPEGLTLDQRSQPRDKGVTSNATNLQTHVVIRRVGNASKRWLLMCVAKLICESCRHMQALA